MRRTETGYAKLNLALHVRRRRDDGYHDIETVFAFCEDGDVLHVAPASVDSLRIVGPFSSGLDAGPDNLVHRAVATVREVLGPSAVPPQAITLDKRLPIAAGVGGGSADAGAVVRLLAPGLVDDRRLSVLGADVAACTVSRTRRGMGTGSTLTPIADDAALPVLLVNPRIALPTGPVFVGWDGIDRGGLPAGGARAAAYAGRNDLESSACALVPAIGDLTRWLAARRGVMVARMSGSGATCFALFEDLDDRDHALAQAKVELPTYWTMASRLR